MPEESRVSPGLSGKAINYEKNPSKSSSFSELTFERIVILRTFRSGEDLAKFVRRA